MNKLTEKTIYDIKYTIKGEEYLFKSIPFKHFPKAFSILGKLGGFKDNSTPEEILSILDEKTMNDIIEIEKIMVSNSYPDYPIEDVEKFVTSNVFQLIEPVVKLCAPGAENELPKKD